MTKFAAVVVAVVLALSPALKVQKAATKSAAKDSCSEQARFDVIMCESYMCTECKLQYCSETCQDIQTQFASCVCSKWANGTTYSDNMPGKGTYGDAGDYGSKPTS
mmetsp:Transcript_892/g.1624  ORF Transcript_892/g.1624 Transcript_892/m.1624 type:complete len:106 (+) Transcript_892:81-398(+)